MQREIQCPQCGQSDQVEKVSTIYLYGIGLSQSPTDSPRPANFKFDSFSKADLRALSRRLKPPASGKRAPTRPLHPDLVVLTFSLVTPIFLYGIYTSQKTSFLPVLAFLILLLGLYAWRRNSIVARFEKQQAARQAAQARVEQAIGRWMKLYYCARDDGVFLPGGAEITPADQMPGLLAQEMRSPS